MYSKVTFNFTPRVTAETPSRKPMQIYTKPEVSRETLLSHIRKLMKAGCKVCVLLLRSWWETTSHGEKQPAVGKMSFLSNWLDTLPVVI